MLRTNVVDRKPYAIRDIAEYQLLPGAARSVQRLQRAGFMVVVMTNQPDIAYGKTTQAMVDAMHVRMQQDLAVDALYMCPHGRDDGCDCRKPKPGMLLAAAREHGLDLQKSWAVGDRASDVAAGVAAGCRTVFIDCDYKEDQPTAQKQTVANLSDAVDVILS